MTTDSALSPPSPYLAIDTETRPDRSLWCVTLSASPGEAYQVREPTELHHLYYWLLAHPRVPAVFHNYLFDGPRLQDILPRLHPIEDTMVASRLLQLDTAQLKELSRRLLGMVMTSYTDLVGPQQARVSLEYLRRALEVARRPDFPVPAPRWELVTVPKQAGVEPRLRRPVPLSRTGKPRSPGAPTPDTGKLARLIADIEAGKPGKDGTPPDPLKRWREWGEEVAPIEAELGPHPVAYLAHVDPDRALHYSARDADATGRLLPVLRAKLQEASLERAYAVDMRALPMVARMSHVGIGVDRDYLQAATRDLEHRVATAQDACWQEAGRPFNPGSDDQVRRILFYERGLEVRGYTRGRLPSTQDDYLLPFRSVDKLAGLVVDYRKLATLKDAYLDPLWEQSRRDGRVHCEFGMTVNHRFAARSPNLMAIPQRSPESRLVRDCFVAGPGRVFAAVDAAQIEMRVLACESLDAELLRVFWEGRDIHTETAIAVLGAPAEDARGDWFRLPAKRVNFGIAYLIQDHGLFVQLEQEVPGRYTRADCATYIRDWYRRYPGVRRYQVEKAAECRRTGEVRDLFGYRRLVYGALSPDPVTRAAAEREGVNFPISSGAVGLVKVWMGQTWGAMEQWPGWEPVLQVHDACYWEGPREEAQDFLAWQQDELARVGESLGLPVAITSSGKTGPRLGELE